MSEESIRMSSQGDSRTPDPPPSGGSKGKPRFAEFACSHTEVIDTSQVISHLRAKMVWCRYTGSLLWSPRLLFQSSFGEETRIYDKS